MNCKVCRNLSSKNPSLSFFRFPSDYNRCREWAERCNILHIFDRYGPKKFYKSFRLCSEHFDCKYIAFDGRKKRLLNNAVPNMVKPKKKSKQFQTVLKSLLVDTEIRVSQKLLQNLCRFCAEENAELTDIFSWQGKTLKLEEKIKVFPIMINKLDKLPLKICSSCIVKISKFYDFVRNCVKADIRLKTILGIADEVRRPKTLIYQTPDKIQANKTAFKDGLSMRKGLVGSFEVVSEEPFEDNSLFFLKSGDNLDLTKQDLPHNFEYKLRKDQDEGYGSKPDNPNETADIGFSCITSEEHILRTKTNDVFGRKISISSEGNVTLDRYCCNICSKTFSAFGILESHWKAHSLQPDKHGRYTCQSCNKLFRNKYRLNEHNRVHTGEYPFKCTICDKKFHKMALLKQHSIVHESVKRFICSICNLRSNRKGNLIQHLRTHYRLLTEENCKSFSLPKVGCIQLDNSTDFQMSKRFSNENIQHIKEKNNHLGNNTAKNTTELTCGTCHKQFLELEALARHFKSHTNALEERCSLFRKGFDLEAEIPSLGNADQSTSESSKQELNSQKKRPHQRAYQCKECGVRFKRKDTLTNHKRIHTGERPFVCGCCGFAFKQKGDCLKHERNHQKNGEGEL